MLTTLIITIVILAFSVVFMCANILLKKNGQFPNTHISGNKALTDRGITCAQSQHADQVARKNLFERMKEI